MQCMCEIIRNVQIAMYYGISSGACTSNIQEKIEKTKENWHKEIGSYTNPKSCFRNSYLNEDLYNTIQAKTLAMIRSETIHNKLVLCMIEKQGD